MTKLIITIALLVASLVGGFYVVHPHYVQRQRKIAENDVLYEELENVVNYINELKRISNSIDENEEDLSRLKTAFPEDHDAPSLFLYLEQQIEDKNLILSSDLGGFTVKNYQQDEGDHPRIKEVIFALSFEGRYNNAKIFFREIETLIRLLKIENINVSSGVSPDSFGGRIVTGNNINIDISGKTYSY